MDEKYYYVIAMVVSVIVFSIVTSRYHWSQIIWSKINTKMKVSLNLPAWFFFAVILQVAIQMSLKALSIDSGIINLILGAVAGLLLMLMPRTSCRVR